MARKNRAREVLIQEYLEGGRNALTRLAAGNWAFREQLFEGFETETPAARSWQGRFLRALRVRGCVEKTGDYARATQYRATGALGRRHFSDEEVVAFARSQGRSLKKGIDLPARNGYPEKTGSEKTESVERQPPVFSDDGHEKFTDVLAPIIPSAKGRTKFENLAQKARAVRAANPGAPAQISFVADKDVVEYLLSIGSPNERRLQMLQVKKLASEQTAGLWSDNPDPICVTTEGVRVNGQHRLHAVRLSGCYSTRLRLEVDVSPEMVKNLDTGKSRSLSDRMTLSGDVGRETAKRLTEFARAFYRGGFPSKLREVTPNELWEFTLRYEEPLEDSMRLLASRRRGVGRAAMGGLFARILYNHPSKEAKLRRAIEVMVDGGYDQNVPGERTLILLKRHLDEAPKKGGGDVADVHTYRVASRAMKAFLAGENLTKLHEASTNYYPIPEDEGVKEFAPKDGNEVEEEEEPRRRKRRA